MRRLLLLAILFLALLGLSFCCLPMGCTAINAQPKAVEEQNLIKASVSAVDRLEASLTADASTTTTVETGDVITGDVGGDVSSTTTTTNVSPVPLTIGVSAVALAFLLMVWQRGLLVRWAVSGKGTRYHLKKAIADVHNHGCEAKP